MILKRLIWWNQKLKKNRNNKNTILRYKLTKNRRKIVVFQNLRKLTKKLKKLWTGLINNSNLEKNFNLRKINLSNNPRRIINKVNLKIIFSGRQLIYLSLRFCIIIKISMIIRYLQLRKLKLKLNNLRI
jgi:hypothetical protein